VPDLPLFYFTKITAYNYTNFNRKYNKVLVFIKAMCFDQIGSSSGYIHAKTFKGTTNWFLQI